VASFLGASALREYGLSIASWLALATLLCALVVAAILLAPWRLGFTLDARDLYDELSKQSASDEHSSIGDGWAAAGFAHQALHKENAPSVRRMSRLSGLLAALMVCQTLAWLAALVVH
jgi:hypothetical protein